MSLLQTIKAAALEARKARQHSTASSLTTLIGELETFSKNVGRQPTDADVVTFLKKTVKNISETLTHLPEVDGRHSALKNELELFEKYLPKQLSEFQLKEAIEGFIAAGCTNIGAAMKLLKEQHGGQFDGAVASSILKTRFSK